MLNKWSYGKKKNSAIIKIDDFPLILEPAWVSAHTSLNIKSGFRTCGIYPPNYDWVKENTDKLKPHNITKEQRFTLLLRKAHLTVGSLDRRLQNSAYLDPALSCARKAKDLRETNVNIDVLLNSIYGSVVAKRFNDDMKVNQRRNRIGELHREAKVLNLIDRIEALYEQKNGKKE
jgi:hypothetical protein